MLSSICTLESSVHIYDTSHSHVRQTSTENRIKGHKCHWTWSVLRKQMNLFIFCVSLCRNTVASVGIVVFAKFHQAYSGNEATYTYTDMVNKTYSKSSTTQQMNKINKIVRRQIIFTLFRRFSQLNQFADNYVHCICNSSHNYLIVVRICLNADTRTHCVIFVTTDQTNRCTQIIIGRRTQYATEWREEKKMSTTIRLNACARAHSGIILGYTISSDDASIPFAQIPPNLSLFFIWWMCVCTANTKCYLIYMNYRINDNNNNIKICNYNSKAQ